MLVAEVALADRFKGAVGTRVGVKRELFDMKTRIPKRELLRSMHSFVCICALMCICFCVFMCFPALICNQESILKKSCIGMNVFNHIYVYQFVSVHRGKDFASPFISFFYFQFLRSGGPQIFRCAFLKTMLKPNIYI